jgi:hypothetical protein
VCGHLMWRAGSNAMVRHRGQSGVIQEGIDWQAALRSRRS